MHKLKLQYYVAVNEVMTRLTVLQRWTSLDLSSNKYNELSKQALNSMVALILIAFSEEAGKSVKRERIPKIALFRAFQKVYVYFDIQEHIINELCEIGNISKDAFYETTKQIIKENTDEEFANFISDGIGTYEMKIYRAATKIATLAELEAHSVQIDREEYSTIFEQLLKSFDEFKDLPGFEEVSNTKGEIFKALKNISKLRNQVRWAVQVRVVSCSVLGHEFQTAILAYLMALEKYSGDETIATKMFFTGLFHDTAETWTGDIPSPIKDMMPGLRKATEELERRYLEKELYSKLPDFVTKRIKDVGLEEECNIQYKKLMKGADYLSADSECGLHYLSGVKEKYFKNTPLQNDLQKIETGEVDMPKVGKEFFDTIYAFAKSLNL